MSDSRSEILRLVRQQLVEAVEHPGQDGPWIRYDDPLAQFTEVLEGVGGRVVLATDLQDVRRQLDEIEPFVSAGQVVSSIADLSLNETGGGDAGAAAGGSESRTVLDLEQIDDPHDLEQVDFAVVPGQFAVAENAAVWVATEVIHWRAVCFLSQHLALVMPRDHLVHSMHEAYQHLQFAGPGFGVFVSGPSKTADIEQSLVIGAHGARSLTVFFVSELSGSEWLSSCWQGAD